MKPFYVKQSRGDVTIYIALVMSFIMMTAAMVLSVTLAKQIKLTTNVENSERAFYASNSGLEDAFYQMSKLTGATADFSVNGSVTYDADTASYSSSANVTGNPDAGKTCISGIVGQFKDEKRKLASSSTGCP